jgi:serine phosphatase RsbU (regulator of sigma subunit)
VGGDWYDVLDLPHGGLALVMGDVEGHDSAAAAIMGQVRTVLSTYVAEGYPPAEILSRTSDFVASHTERLVSCCYVELHPNNAPSPASAPDTPAPWFSTPTTAPESCPSTRLPLGVLPNPAYLEHTEVLLPGACLALVTDGLFDVLPG